MVQKRERVKKRVLNCQQEILELESSLLLSSLLSQTQGEGASDVRVEEAKGEEGEEREGETDTKQSPRLTRYWSAQSSSFSPSESCMTHTFSQNFV